MAKAGNSGGRAWWELLEVPVGGRAAKPRQIGLTMVIDKGLGLLQTRELLEVGSEYIDFIKLGFGTSALYSTDLLRAKIDLVTSYGVDIFPGGTFLEVAIIQGKLDVYLRASRELGYTCIEVSDGTIDMSSELRALAIAKALDQGFKVISEVGKKDPRERVEAMHLVEQIWEDLKHGACKVIVEGRESGQSVVIYDQQGAIIEEELETFAGQLADTSRVIWEAPLKHQQQELILRFGPNVNLGNIQAQDVLALEALRLGLRGDTLRAVVLGR